MCEAKSVLLATICCIRCGKIIDMSAWSPLNAAWCIQATQFLQTKWIFFLWLEISWRQRGPTKTRQLTWAVTGSWILLVTTASSYLVHSRNHHRALKLQKGFALNVERYTWLLWGNDWSNQAEVCVKPPKDQKGPEWLFRCSFKNLDSDG